mmetsp:Transcript_29658/g.78549  ORF Transcript_29658/g.78549 Transcript_29658/m.78549 type:complete len:222 (-) Transcript_29658:484-1149(-)
MRHRSLLASCSASSKAQSTCEDASTTSASSKVSSRYSCRSASWALTLLFGSNCSRQSSMSHCAGVALGNMAVQLFLGRDGNRVLMKLRAASLAGGMKDSSSSVGVPRISQILWIWSRKSLPRNMGTRPMSSPRMHPALQMSTAAVYSIDVRTTSGARYQRVPTYSVRRKSSSSCEKPARPRASPKSQSLMSQFLFTSTFSGLRSLCTTLAECMYSSARRMW